MSIFCFDWIVNVFILRTRILTNEPLYGIILDPFSHQNQKDGEQGEVVSEKNKRLDFKISRIIKNQSYMHIQISLLK